MPNINKCKEVLEEIEKCNKLYIQMEHLTVLKAVLLQLAQTALHIILDILKS